MMRSIPIIGLPIVILLIWIACIALSAQSSDNLLGFEARFERFNLPGQDVVLKMHQDSIGFLWFASKNGLVRYDGLRYVTFSHDSLNTNSPVNNNLEYIYEDKQGIFWLVYFGSGVLTSFDPIIEKFTHDTLPNADLVPNPWGHGIVEDCEGFLWIGTNHGLYRLDSAREQFESFLHDPGDTNSLSHNNIKELFVDSDCTLWIGAGFRWAETEYYLTNLQSDHSGGLHRYRSQTRDFERFVHKPNNAYSLRDSRIGAIYEDSRQNFWTGAWSDGLHKMDRISGTFEHFPYNPMEPAQLSHPFAGNLPDTIQTNNHVTFIREDRNKRLWIGSWGGGLNVHDLTTGKTKHFENEPDDPTSLPVNAVWDCYETRRGTIWIITGGRGVVFKVNEEAGIFPFHDLGSFLQNRIVDFTCVVEDDQGMVWLGTDNWGLIQLDPDSKELISHYQFDRNNDHSVSSNRITGIRQDRDDGSMWVSTPFGLNQLNLATGKFTRFQNDLADPSSLQYFAGQGMKPIFQDGEGNIWVTIGHGPTGGLHRLDRRTGKFKIYTHTSDPNTIGGNYVQAMHEDNEGSIWVGGRSFLDRYSHSSDGFEHFDLPDRVEGVLEIISDRDGKIWLMSWTNELWQLDPLTRLIRSFTRENSTLPIDKIYAFFKSRDGQIWMRSENALLALNPGSEGFQLYPSPQMRQQESSRGRFLQGSDFINSQGTLFFAAERGYYSFHPDGISVMADQKPPRIVISDLRIDQGRIIPGGRSPLTAPIWETKEVKLSYNQNSLSLSISCLDYKNPEANQLEYRLDGYDPDWRSDHRDGLTAYDRLPPGRYVFRVRGASSEGVWNQDGAVLQIRITPPWWKTILARSIFIALSIGIIFIVFRFQLNRRIAMAEALRLRELDQVKNRLYTNITHEFRTPLTIISGMAGQIKENPKSKEVLQDGIRMIERNSDKILNLVNQMLDLRKLESGNMGVHFQQRDIIAYLRYILDSFQSYGRGKSTRLHFISDLESFCMDVDDDKILKIVTNLLSNAIKFTKEDGDVYLTVRHHLNGIAGKSRDGQSILSEALEIQVKDTGIGISADQLLHIFDRFYQADDRSIRRAEGTGIGLALTKELVKVIGGEISVKSYIGKGSTFIVLLPVTRQAEQGEIPMSTRNQITALFTAPNSLSRKEMAGQSLGEERPLVLIVEDNNDVVYYLRICLEKDYHVAVATNGQEGIEMALEMIPDIIISDVMMPEVDGYLLCQTLKEDERSSHIPIILLTAKADHFSKVEGLQKGADAYLSKPFERDELLIRLQQLIDLRRRLQEKYNSGNFRIEATTREEDEFVIKVRQLVIEQLDDNDFTILPLSRKLGINRVHLHRKIKALTGKTAALFIRQIRLEEGHSLLLNSDLNVSEIAYKVGFRDPSYFSRVFTETFGRSPRAIRNSRLR